MTQEPARQDLASMDGRPAESVGTPHGPAIPVGVPAGASDPTPLSHLPHHLEASTNPWTAGIGALLVRDVMTRRVIKTNPEASLRKAAQLLLRNHITGMPVLQGTKVVGVLSEKDIVRVVLSKIGRALLPAHLLALFLEITAEEEARTLAEIQQVLDGTTVAQAMTDHPITVESGSPLDQAMRLMIQHGVHRLPVLEGGKLVGILTRDDALRGSAGALD